MSVCKCFAKGAEIATYVENYQFLYIQCTKCGTWYSVSTADWTPTGPPPGFEDVPEKQSTGEKQ